MLKIYNSLTKEIETFKPIISGQVKLYSCGPTVYERAHIGNLASFIYVDTLRRTLETSGYKVKHVMNITDIDDKTIAASKAIYPELPPTEALSKLTKKYEKIFLSDLEAVGIDTDKISFVRATENIESMQTLILKLLDKGFAYQAADGIYFSINKYRKADKKYGQLVELSVDQTHIARINNDEYDKDEASDFVLWKAQKDHEPAWDFKLPDGQNLIGRPGWHIECSAMSEKYLHIPFDIHTGGIDLKFPHHENEIAQSTALGSDRLSNIFFHNEHMLVNEQKMSKSLGNYYHLADITKKGTDPLAFRLLVLQSHYQKPSNFNWEALEAASNRLKSYRAFADIRHQPLLEINIVSANKNEGFEQTYEGMSSGLVREASENLDTPSLFAFLDSYISRVESTGYNQKYFQKFLKTIDDLLGLDLSNRPDISSTQKQFMNEREDARKNNDWSKADELRKKLSSEGVEINDTPAGSIWYRP
ncbi:MAG: cysteine--tRNA ligase [Candidatus Saccharimonadales bacterium]